MAKLTRNRLTRGTKLRVESYNNVVGNIANELSSVAINADQLKRNVGTFNIAYNLYIFCNSQKKSLTFLKKYLHQEHLMN